MSITNNHKEKPSTFFWVVMFLINIFILGLVVGFQYLNYNHLRFVPLHDTNFSKEQLLEQTIAGNNKMLVLMIIFGSMFLLVINYFRMARVVKKPLYTTLIFILAYYIISGLSLYLISHHFYTTNIAL